MTRPRGSLILLGICVLALIVSWLRVVRQDLPGGSSFSEQPDGARALYDWTAAIGAAPTRLLQPTMTDPEPRLLIVLQPETPLPERDRDAFDEVPRSGGTLVLAGDSPATFAYARSLGVTIEPAQTAAVAHNADGVAMPVASHSRLVSDGAEPLLRAPNGDVLALRKRYRGGSLVVIAAPGPLTNAGLRDRPTAQFVYREILSRERTSAIAFDEAHHAYVPLDAQTPTLNQLALTTAPGRAVLYGIAVVFVCLFLGGRRLGPPLPERGAAETRRTMFEHVQMLAGLHRRAGHLAMVRSALARHYARVLQRGSLAPVPAARVSGALARVDMARSEADLLAAVGAAEDA